MKSAEGRSPRRDEDAPTGDSSPLYRFRSKPIRFACVNPFRWTQTCESNRKVGGCCPANVAGNKRHSNRSPAERKNAAATGHEPPATSHHQPAAARRATSVCSTSDGDSASSFEPGRSLWPRNSPRGDRSRRFAPQTRRSLPRQRASVLAAGHLHEARHISQHTQEFAEIIADTRQALWTVVEIAETIWQR